MTPEVENALRSVARKCRQEIISSIKGKPKSDHDPIITEILNKHAKAINPLSLDTFPPKLWLGYYIRKISEEQ